jgi:hypothetical protein
VSVAENSSLRTPSPCVSTPSDPRATPAATRKVDGTIRASSSNRPRGTAAAAAGGVWAVVAWST